MLRSRTSLGGLVTAPHHLAAEAGADVLREGGNAIEAMIASAATIAVVYPHMNAIGGDGFWLVACPGNDPIGVQACGPSAALATPEFYKAAGDAVVPTRGPRAALTVAGAVAGWMEAEACAREIGGCIPVSRLLEPAIHYAQHGVPVCKSQERLTREKWDELKNVIGFRDVYAINGPPNEGDILQQPKLAATLAHFGQVGLDAFYRGDIARMLAAGLETSGSPLRLNDLEVYRATRILPLRIQLAAGEVFGMPPPTQGVSSLMLLRLFERLGVKQAETFEHIHGLIEATKRAFLLCNAHVGDPDRMSDEWRRWLLDDAISQETAAIDMDNAAPWTLASIPGDTIWMGAADDQGNVVSYMQSNFWEFGSGVVVPETGVLWQNRGASFTLSPGANELGAGRLTFHTLNPAMARLKDGRTIAYGTMGGEGQPQTQAAIFSRHVMFGQDMQAAVTAPRWLLGRTWGASSANLKLESRFDPVIVRALEKVGHDVEIVDEFHDMMGHAGMVSIAQDGLIRGATDPRADGNCATL